MTSIAAHTALLLESLAPSRPLRVLDVGANPLEDPPYGALLRAGGCALTGFEPQEAAFARLQAEKGPNETYFRQALGDGREHTLHVTKFSGFTSLYEPDAASTAMLGFDRGPKVTGREPITTTRLDDVPGLEPQDVLKIDVQGAEMDIIQSGRRVLAEAMVLIPEVRFTRLYRHEPLFGVLDTAIRDAGFTLHKFLSIKSARMPSKAAAGARARWSRSQMVDGDAVYIRDPLGAALWSDDQLAHLGLAADAIFASPDLTLFCLEVLAERGKAPSDLAKRYMALVLPEQMRIAAGTSQQHDLKGELT